MTASFTERLGMCELCKAHCTTRKNTAGVPSEAGNNGLARVLVLGDVPTVQEARSRTVWQREGLDKIKAVISQAIPSDSLEYGYAVRCPTPDGSSKHIKTEYPENCRSWLIEELERFPNVEVILACGKAAGATVLGVPLAKGGEAQGQLKEVMLGERKVRVVTTVHPYQAILMPFALEQFRTHVNVARLALDSGYSSFQMASHLARVRYKFIESEDELREALAECLESPLVTVDTETRGVDPWHTGEPSNALFVTSVQLCPEEGRAFFIPISSSEITAVTLSEIRDRYISHLKEFFQSYTGTLAYHNAKFDQRALGLIFGFVPKVHLDTMSVDHLVRGLPARSLKKLAWEVSDMGGYESEMAATTKEHDKQYKHDSYYYPLRDILFPYGCCDVDVTWRAASRFTDKLLSDPTTNELTSFLAEASTALAEIELDGWKVDVDYLEDYGKRKLKEAEGYAAGIREIAGRYVLRAEKFMKSLLLEKMEKHRASLKRPPKTSLPTLDEIVLIFDPTNNNHVITLLYDILDLTVSASTPKGKPSVDSHALKDLKAELGVFLGVQPPADPSAMVFDSKTMSDEDRHSKPKVAYAVIERLLKLRKATKAYDAFYERWKKGLSQKGRLHFEYNLVKFRDDDDKEEGTNSGRLSSSGAAGNIQQVTKDPDIRKVFVPDDDQSVLLDVDYSTLEYVVAAIHSKDPKLCDAFRKGYDVHAAVAAEVFGGTPEEMMLPENKKIRQRAKCFHPRTEVLTRSGWKKILDLRPGEEVVQAEPGVDRQVSLSWAVPTEVFSQNHPDRKLVHLKNEGIDLSVTPDHRMLSWTAGGTKKVTTPSGLAGAGYLANAGWAGGAREVDPRLLRLAVAVQADGSYPNQSGIRFGFSKVRKFERLVQLLTEFPGQYTSGVWSNGIFWVRLGGELARSVRGLLDGKKFPWWWLGLTPEHREVVLDEARHWDAHTRQNWAMYAFYSGQEQNVDVLQALASMHNRKTRKRVVTEKSGKSTWALSIKDHNYTHLTTVKKVEVDWTDKVACLSVPSTFVLVRDGGVPVVTGQTLNFSVLFSAGASNVAEQLGIDKTAAERFLEEYKEKFPTLFRHMARVRKYAVTHGEVLSKFGRRRALPDAMLPIKDSDPWSPEKSRKLRALRQSVNTGIQGDASDICLRGLLRVREWLKSQDYRTRIKATIHDALIFSVPFDELDDVSRNVKRILENPPDRWIVESGVPLRVAFEMGLSWGEMSPVEVA